MKLKMDNGNEMRDDGGKSDEHMLEAYLAMNER